MDDSKFGKRDKRGNWTPNDPIEYPPVFIWPAKPLAFLKWIPEYLFPWNAIYALCGLGMWMYLTPSIETMKTLSWDWTGYLLARNALIIVLVYGGWHFYLYIMKAQGTSFKFNAQWPSTNNDAFLFKNQNIDNMIWTFASALPIWTAYEILMLWCFSNGYVPWVNWEEHPIYCAILLLLVPLLHDTHFYLIHRMIHWPPLYRMVHSLHHNNVNPGPWSGLAMHPVEHVLYFSGVLLHLIIPSHPVHAMFHLVLKGFAPAQGHAGFDQVVMGEEKGVHTGCFPHYLHHKYFECNYADGTVPLDKWFGTFHDGTRASQDAMDARMMARIQKQQEKQAASQP